MLTILISCLSWILQSKHHQLKKVCIQIHQWECMPWNTLNGVMGQLWEMSCLWDKLELFLISSLILEQMPTSNWPKKQAWSLVWNFGWISILKRNCFMHWNNLYIFQIATNFIFQVPYTHNMRLIILLAKIFLTLFFVYILGSTVKKQWSLLVIQCPIRIWEDLCGLS